MQEGAPQRELRIAENTFPNLVVRLALKWKVLMKSHQFLTIGDTVVSTYLKNDLFVSAA